DRNGAPFPILGRTSWAIMTLSVADRRLYLDDCVAKGYTAIEMGILWAQPTAKNIPFDGAGDAPFLRRLDGSAWNGAFDYAGSIDDRGPDFSTPNPAYWSWVDGVMSDALARGLLVLAFPAYTGAQGGSDGWLKEMVANGTANMTGYGAFVAGRYKNQPNIVWMAGGDYGTGNESFTSAELPAEQAWMTGMQSVAGQQSVLV